MEFGVLDYLYPRKFRDMRVFIVILFISMYFFSFSPHFIYLSFYFDCFFCSVWFFCVCVMFVALNIEFSCCIQCAKLCVQKPQM